MPYAIICFEPCLPAVAGAVCQLQDLSGETEASNIGSHS